MFTFTYHTSGSLTTSHRILSLSFAQLHNDIDSNSVIEFIE